MPPGDVDVHVLMAQALAERTSNGHAEEAAPRTSAGAPQPPLARDTAAPSHPRLALAVALLSEGDLERARSAPTDAVDSNPVLAPAYVQRGIARFGLRVCAGALRDLRRAHRLDPHDPARYRSVPNPEMRGRLSRDAGAAHSPFGIIFTQSVSHGLAKYANRPTVRSSSSGRGEVVARRVAVGKSGSLMSRFILYRAHVVSPWWRWPRPRSWRRAPSCASTPRRRRHLVTSPAR